MSLNICSNSALSQTQSVSNWRSATSRTQSEAATDGAGRAEPAGKLINAIANALQNLADSAGTSSTTSSDGTTSSESSTSTDNSNAAQALGDFLQNLMSALQQQSPQGAGKPPPPRPEGSIANDEGPLAKDLQKLISSLTTESSSDTTSTSVSSNEGSDSTSALESSFEQLLSALSIAKSSGTSQLQSFLNDVMTQVSGHGAQGNWINTSA